MAVPVLFFRLEMKAELYYTPKLLQVGEFKEAFERAVEAVLGSDAQISVHHKRHTGRAGVSDHISLDTESLRAIVDLNKIDIGLSATIVTAPHDSRIVVI